jgi:putative component of toxin-antitoxin plasmid stabilization module
VRARIRARIARLRVGRIGDVKRVGEVLELRIRSGPGYRIYRSQERDIQRATAYWREYRSRKDG